MSWDGYRDTLLRSENLAQSAICSLKDGGVWSASPDMNVTQDEALRLVQGFSDPSILYSGIYVGGEKYMFIKGTPEEIHGKKGLNGVTIAKSNICLLIGCYKDGMQPGGAALTLGKMMDYLKALGY